MRNQAQRRSENLIREVLQEAAAAGNKAARSLVTQDLHKTKKSDVDLICRLLLDELTTKGLDKHSEPTKRGLEIEAAIDWIRSQ